MVRNRVVQWDLHANDAVAQRAFYSELFGWRCSNLDDPAQYGWMTTPDGRMVGGIGQLNEGETPGVAIFVNVHDVPATVQNAELLGGSILWGPVNAPDGMATAGIADPLGNALLLIQPSATGEPYTSRPPANCEAWGWEIQSPDPAALAPFYAALFGWTFDGLNDWGWGPMQTGVDGGPDGALATGDTPCTFFYAPVADLPATVRRAEALGGRVVVEPWQVTDELEIAVLIDPEGNRVGLRSLTEALSAT